MPLSLSKGESQYRLVGTLLDRTHTDVSDDFDWAWLVGSCIVAKTHSQKPPMTNGMRIHARVRIIWYECIAVMMKNRTRKMIAAAIDGS